MTSTCQDSKLNQKRRLTSWGCATQADFASGNPWSQLAPSQGTCHCSREASCNVQRQMVWRWEWADRTKERHSAMSWKNRKLHDFTYKGTCQSTHHCFRHIAPDTSLFQCVANLPSRGIPVHIRSVDSDETSKHILLIPIFLKVGSTQYTCITITVLGYDKHGSFINRKEWTHLIFLSNLSQKSFELFK